MKSSPLLFRAEMVCAILREIDSKTQTRRTEGLDAVNAAPDDWNPLFIIPAIGLQNKKPTVQFLNSRTGLIVDCISKKGMPGDQIWVREDYYQFGHWEPVANVKTKRGRQKWKFCPESDRITFDPPKGFYGGRRNQRPGEFKWFKRLARFMPRKYSRITLELTAVRVERLNSISEADAKAEGVADTFDARIASKFVGGNPGPAQMEYWALWESINGPGSWAANQWVWVYEFKKL